MPLTLGVVSNGRKSGKTRLIEELVRLLKERGYKVCTIKHVRSRFDTPHKDTWRHLQAGASVVIAVTPGELVSIRRLVSPPMSVALDEVPKDMDIVLIEGFRGERQPKIVLAKTVDEAEKLLGEARSVVAISGLMSEERRTTSIANVPVLKAEEIVSMIENMTLQSIVSKLPGLDCKRCGYDSCGSLAKAIQREEASIDLCEALSVGEVTLTVDGKDISLNKFTQRFMKGTVLGMIGSLKGIEKLEKVVLEIK